MKRKIYCTIGLIASGKSTWAKQFITENKDTVRVSRDDIRYSLNNYDYTPENEKIVDKLYRGQITILLENTNKNIILDEQNLNKERLLSFQFWMQSITKDGLEFIEREFPISLSQAIERNSKREFPIGKNVIKRTWDKYEIYLKRLYENSKFKQRYQEQLQDCIIFDIDGTLCRSLNRKTFDESQVSTDEPIEEVIRLNKILASTGDKIFIVSGRHDTCQADTEKWLKENGVRYNDIFMRKADDNRQDTIIKREIYEEHIKGKYNVLGVFDDRISVLEMWISEGLFVFNVNQDPMCKNNF